MWHDDDGEDDPIAGPVPDPSERSWRHPSEIGDELRRAARSAEDATDAAPGRSGASGEPGGPSAASSGGRGEAGPGGGSSDPVDPPLTITDGQRPGRRRRSAWVPVPVVGSCVAAAALGLLALFVVGPASDDEQVTAGVGPVSGSDRTPVSGIVSDRQTTTTSIAAPEPRATAGTTAAASTTTTLALDRRAESMTTASSDTAASSTTLIGDAAERAGEASVAPDEAAAAAPAVPLPPSDSKAPGVYHRLDTDRRLAAFVAVDELIVTSAGAVAVAEDLLLWIGDGWVDATVVATDRQSDVAVLRTLDPVLHATLPTLEPAPEQAEAGLAVTVESPRRGVVSGYSPYATTRRARERTPSAEEGTAATTTGKVIALTISTTHAGHELHGTLRTSIPATPGLIGGPLLDEAGRVIGVIVDATGPNVSAVPLDTAVDYARSLVETGLPATEWASFQAVEGGERPGVRVAEVESGTGAPDELDLQPGDRLIAMDEQPLRNLDHFYHLVRQAGPGASVTVSVVRDGEPMTVPIEITPPAER